MQRDAIREEGRAFPSPSRSGKRKRREVWGDSARRSRARVTRSRARVGCGVRGCDWCGMEGKPDRWRSIRSDEDSTSATRSEDVKRARKQGQSESMKGK